MPYEAQIKIEFSTPCLGNDRRDDPEPNRMVRSSSGSVIFLQSWWWGCTRAAAQRFNMHQKRIHAVKWSAEVDGTTKLFDRYYHTGGKRKIKQHEAFLQQDVVGVRALVPDDIPLDDFKEILSIAGEYFGISPYGWKRGFGKFKVVEVSKIYGHSAKSQGEHAGSISDGSKNHRFVGSDNIIQTKGDEGAAGCDGREQTIPSD